MHRFLLVFVLLTAVSSFSQAQEATENTIFDYSETRHEFSLDLAPIILGNYPGDLLYRKHYISKNGKNVALRVGAMVNANFGSTENLGGNPNSSENQNVRLNLYIGKEWQKTIQKKIIGYYGLDFGVGYSETYLAIDTDDNNPNFAPLNQSSFGLHVNATGFLGVRYHISKHFSLSTETALLAGFNHHIQENSFAGVSSPNTVNNNFNFGMMPLRAVRFAFHF
jgi:hypothetical protein